MLNPGKASAAAMEEGSSSAPKPNSSSSCCDECGVNPSKYKCPGCSVRSCSLPCVKSHKLRTSCTGKRPRTQFVPLSQFDDNLLLSDYHFLEEAKRVSDSARRRRGGLPGRSYFKFPYHLKGLKNAAAARKTHLLFLPSGMSKREKNRTRCDFRKKCISWTIEWRLHPIDLVLINNGVDENTSLYSVIEKHLEPSPWNTQLKPFCEQLDFLKFFIRKNAKGTKSPFRELDIKAPLRHLLANTVIVEYPVIHVFLPSASLDFEIVKDLQPFSKMSELEEPVNDGIPSPKQFVFREEEVEDNSDPHVLDLMAYMNPELADIELLAQHNEGRDESNLRDTGVIETFDFGFEQDLRDAFSGLINPDEFLDFDGFYCEGSMIDEELEEGEIPTF